MTRFLCAIAVAAMLASAGCAGGLNHKFTQDSQKQLGMVYILPGIQGVDSHYINIRKGLASSGVNCGIMIHPWGCRIPGINLMINQTDSADDRTWGRRIAADIVSYQKAYPGQPVHLIGQSGGAGVAVFTAEALADIPDAKPISGLVLLDASLSADYDLTKALSMCRSGIANFYNLRDVALLEVGTAMFGNVDGGHGDSAGRTGFENTYPNLYQVQVTADMVNDLDDPHFADCSSAFAGKYIAQWISGGTWPLATAQLARR